MTRPVESRQFTSPQSSDSVRAFDIVAKRLPEGVWLATCDEIPGLILETDTFDELKEEVATWAEELARENGIIDLGQRPVFVIRREGANWTNGNFSFQGGIGERAAEAWV
jgi:predicted RNase H-like HicB family nuclease